MGVSATEIIIIGTIIELLLSAQHFVRVVSFNLPKGSY